MFSHITLTFFPIHKFTENLTDLFKKNFVYLHIKCLKFVKKIINLLTKFLVLERMCWAEMELKKKIYMKTKRN